MRQVGFFLLLLSAILLQSCVPDDHEAITYVSDVSGTSDLSVYRLAPGDQIRLIVLDQPSLSNVYNVDPSGHVSIPLAGTVKAEGKTTKELEAAIVNRFKDENLLSDARAAVEVATFRPFSIIGEVRSPGRFPYAPGLTVDFAVAFAGGYTIHADTGHIRVTRRVSSGKTVTDYLPSRAIVLPDDIISVPERWF